MTQPFALVFYERLMPGSQLVIRLQDMNYRVLVVNNAALLAATVKREMPMLLLADFEAQADVRTAVEKIKADPATAHVAIIAFGPDDKVELLTTAKAAGANLAIGESTLVTHLPQVLDQALHVE